MSVHTIGDSHSTIEHGWPAIVQNHHLGAKLCFSIGRDKLDILDIRNYNIKNGDIVIFSFGEIDCRAHIHKHLPYEESINGIVERYFETIKLNIDVSGLNIKTCVYNVPPPPRKNGIWENPEFPFEGSDEERKTYSLYFNKKLKEKCQDYGYTFFDIYDKYIDDDGFLIREMSDGNVHIKDGKYISEFLSTI